MTDKEKIEKYDMIEMVIEARMSQKKLQWYAPSIWNNSTTNDFENLVKNIINGQKYRVKPEEKKVELTFDDIDPADKLKNKTTGEKCLVLEVHKDKIYTHTNSFSYKYLKEHCLILRNGTWEPCYKIVEE